MISSQQQIDRNRRTVNSNEAIITSSAWTFAAGTTGAVGAHTLFTVTGDVLVNVFGNCSTLVTGSGTGEVGVVGNTAGLIAQTTGTDIDANEVWQNDAPTLGIGADVNVAKPIVGGLDIILTIGTDTFTAGVITFYCLWRPLNNSSSLVATTPA